MKRLNKFFAVLLAIAMVFTSLGTDFASVRTYAADNEIVTEESEEEKSELFEDVTLDDEDDEDEEDADEAEEEEDVPDAAAEGAPEADAQNDEVTGEGGEGSDESGNPAAIDGSTEESAEEASDEASAELSEDAADAASSEASIIEEKEKKTLEFNQEREVDGILVSLYAVPGVLPADAVLEVKRMENKEDEIAEVIEDELPKGQTVEETISFDISIYSPSEGKNVQPEEGTVNVTFTDIRQAQDEDLALSVYHVNDSITDADCVAKAKEEDATDISFDAKHFSIYTITLTRKEVDESKFKVKIKLQDMDGKDILQKDIKDSKEMEHEYGGNFIYGYYYKYSYKYVSEIAPTVAGYKFKSAVIDNMEFEY
ncbi:MAG: hypothetical protein K6G10_00940, partial [Butyrivibrio sp.]|nr:hypothetical protein [Butyrivibrio sp.]